MGSGMPAPACARRTALRHHNTALQILDLRNDSSGLRQQLHATLRNVQLRLSTHSWFRKPAVLLYCGCCSLPTGLRVAPRRARPGLVIKALLPPIVVCLVVPHLRACEGAQGLGAMSVGLNVNRAPSRRACRAHIPATCRLRAGSCWWGHEACQHSLSQLYTHTRARTHLRTCTCAAAAASILAG